MAIKLNTYTVLSIGLSSMILLTSGCVPSKFQERIDETEEINQTIIQEEKEKDIVTEDTLPEDVHLKEDQLEVLEKLPSVTPEEAVDANQLEVREEQTLDGPVNMSKKVYTDAEEFSRFISELFYKYHSNQITAKVFYEKVQPHFHDKFTELLPESKDTQLRTFEILQEKFREHLPSEITDYVITKVQTDPRTQESSFYRHYTLKNGESAYYETIIQPVDNQWLLVDDKPAPPYQITPTIQNEISEQKEITQP